MKLTQWTIFIDMLGFRDINGSINSEAKAMEFIDFMDLNKKIIGYTDSSDVKTKYAKYGENNGFDLYRYYDIQSTFVSDSLIITYYPKNVDEPENVSKANMHSANALFIISMRLVTFLYHCFSKKGLFLRGGISNKYCYIKDNFAVGEGLIEAYLAESKYAKNPRLVLHPEVQKNSELMDKISLLSQLMYGGQSIIKLDEDGLYFIDYIGYVISTIDISIPMINQSKLVNPIGYTANCQATDDYIREHSEAITKKLKGFREKQKNIEPSSTEALKIESLISKFTWLQNYHNTKIMNHEFLKKYISA